jgi:hypothetical protein
MKYYWSSDVLPILYEMYNADTLPEVKRLAHERRMRQYQVRSINMSAHHVQAAVMSHVK